MILGMLTPSRQDADAVIELLDRIPAEALAEFRRLADGEPTRRSRCASVRGRSAGGQCPPPAGPCGADRRGPCLSRPAHRARRSTSGSGWSACSRTGRCATWTSSRRCLRLDGRHAARGTGCSRPAWRRSHVLREDLEQLARGLHPRVLAERGLAAALEELCQPQPGAGRGARSGRTLPGADRDHGLVRLRGGAGQRVEVRPGHAGSWSTSRCHSPEEACGPASTTTASAELGCRPAGD